MAQGNSKWGRNLCRVGAAGAVIFLLTYGSDVLLTSRLDLLLPADASSTDITGPPASAWQMETCLSAAASPNLSERGNVDVFDDVQKYIDLTGNDLAQRVAAMKQDLGIDLDAHVRDGAAAVSLRELADQMGARLHWPGSGPARLIGSDGLSIFYPGKAFTDRNYRRIDLPRALWVESDELYAPLASCAKAFGMSLDRDAATGICTLASDAESVRILPVEHAFRIEIDRSDRWLQVYYAGRLVKHYRCCPGEGQNTPIGKFHIQNKSVWPSWRAYWGELIPGGTSRNPLGARFLGTSARGRVTGWTIGIHGTNQPSSIGRRISGGCVRLLNEHAIEVYEVIPIGTRVTVHE